jgi:hypothetical protein
MSCPGFILEAAQYRDVREWLSFRLWCGDGVKCSATLRPYRSRVRLPIEAATVGSPTRRVRV